MFATEGVQKYDESSANSGRKRPLKTKKSAGFQPYVVSFTSFLLDLRHFYLFSVFFGLTKCDSPFLVLFSLLICVFDNQVSEFRLEFIGGEVERVKGGYELLKVGISLIFGVSKD